MQTVYLTCGLPGCGKSTWAREKAKEDLNVAIVCRDDLRTMFKGVYYYDTVLEPAIVDMAMSVLDILLDRGYDVIVDETNLTKKRRAEILSRIRQWCERKYGQETSVLPVGQLSFRRMPEPAIKVICVEFPEDERHLERRMKENRGYTPEKWTEVVEGMKKTREPVTLDEGFTNIITVRSTDD